MVPEEITYVATGQTYRDKNNIKSKSNQIRALHKIHYYTNTLFYIHKCSSINTTNTYSDLLVTQIVVSCCPSMLLHVIEISNIDISSVILNGKLIKG